MSTSDPRGRKPYEMDEDDDMIEEDEYDAMELLERLETLREDMEDLGVTTLAEVTRRINELHRRLDSKYHD